MRALRSCLLKTSVKVGWRSHPVLEKRTKTVGYSKETLDSCSFCQKFCEEACPRLQHWAALEVRNILSATAHGPVRSGAPNDVIRAIVTAGRSAGLLDGVIMLDIDPWTLEPVARVVSTVLEIVSTVGPQYLWSPVFEVLNQAVFREGMEDIAVVSTPCAAQAIRKLKSSTNPRLQPYQDAIRLTLAVFCTGIYQPEMVEEILVKRMDVPREHFQRLEITPVSAQWAQYLWSPVFEKLNQAVFREGMEDIAVVSTPCAAQAIRKLKAFHQPTPATLPGCHPPDPGSILHRYL